MFTIPASGAGIILVARPSASSGTITNPTYAYDLPGGVADDPPYSTKASVATILGSATPGSTDSTIVEYNTFPSRTKSTFSTCTLVVAFDLYLTQYTAPIPTAGSFQIQYQIDGSTWVNFFNTAGKPEQPYVTIEGGPPAYTSKYTELVKSQISAIIPSASFPSNLNSLKVRFVANTLTESTGVWKSGVAYNVWDIRANIS